MCTYIRTHKCRYIRGLHGKGWLIHIYEGSEQAASWSFLAPDTTWRKLEHCWKYTYTIRVEPSSLPSFPSGGRLKLRESRRRRDYYNFHELPNWTGVRTYVDPRCPQWKKRGRERRIYLFILGQIDIQSLWCCQSAGRNLAYVAAAGLQFVTHRSY